MKLNEITPYYNAFENLHDWAKVVDELDSTEIKSIKKEFLKHEWYKQFCFVYDNLPAIESIDVTKDVSSVSFGGIQKQVSAKMNRIKRDAVISIVENGKVVDSAKAKLHDSIVEGFFRDLESKVFQDEMKDENRNMRTGFDGLWVSGNVKWYGGESIDFKSIESYDAVDVKEIITAIEKMISESIRSNLEAL